MGDVRARQPHFYEDPDITATVQVKPGETSLRAAKQRSQGVQKAYPPLYPEYPDLRVRCESGSCWKQAHEIVEDVNAEWALCPWHAEVLRDVMAEDPDLSDPPPDLPAKAPVSRAAMGLSGYQRNRPDRPSKTPAGRQAEYARQKALRAGNRTPPDPSHGSGSGAGAPHGSSQPGSHDGPQS